jgi:hypothetical protein
LLIEKFKKNAEDEAQRVRREKEKRELKSD